MPYQNDVKHALKNKDQVRLNVVRSILTDITYATKSSSNSSHIGSSDQDIYLIINRAIKRHKESIDQFSQAGRTDLVENEELELEILNSYLPQQMSEQEIETEVVNVIQRIGVQGGIQNLGKVMKELNLDVGRAPKNVVAQPPPPGQKRVKEDWENIWYYGMGGCLLLGIVIAIYKPDTR
ncbi:9541_t:CDS:2 [Acaulospora colombiana]|uniref:9541_t:CDS:1 n=1 Tax=Acaulospora colombiana TaxID=27376 RepID=A0ACA9LB68_9GLOM|nr:9541_t:CDS:2 [Acaulospora colombiana]